MDARYTALDIPLIDRRRRERRFKIDSRSLILSFSLSLFLSLSLSHEESTSTINSQVASKAAWFNQSAYRFAEVAAGRILTSARACFRDFVIPAKTLNYVKRDGDSKGNNGDEQRWDNERTSERESIKKREDREKKSLRRCDRSASYRRSRLCRSSRKKEG